jgi:endonuclease G
LKKLTLLLTTLLLALTLFAEPTSIADDRYEKKAGGKSYVLYYNEDAEIPSLVWYIQTKEDAQRNDSSISRPTWKEDKEIRTGSALDADYKYSGYDRGHMAPDADFSQTREILALTYFMSNVVPQYHSFNAGIWAQAENRGRELVNLYGKVLIVSGPCLRGDLTKDANIIGSKNLVLVPDYFYKLFVYREGGKLVYEGYIFPHVNGAGNNYRAYKTTPEQIQEWGQFVLDDIEDML